MTDHLMHTPDIHVILSAGWAVDIMMPYGHSKIVDTPEIVQFDCAARDGIAREITTKREAVVAGDRVKRRYYYSTLVNLEKVISDRPIDRPYQILTFIESLHKGPVTV